MDALFIPQDHPAREMQDTFYLDNPSKMVLPDEIMELWSEIIPWRRYRFSRLGGIF